jgi:hypothetical protein
MSACDNVLVAAIQQRHRREKNMSNIREVTLDELKVLVANADEIRDCRSAIVNMIAYEVTQYSDVIVLEVYDAQDICNLSYCARDLQLDYENPIALYIADYAHANEIHDLFCAKIREAMRLYE